MHSGRPTEASRPALTERSPAAERAIAILGATGSIGGSCLDVVRHHPGRLRICGLTAWSNVSRLRELVAEFHPAWAVVGGEPDGADTQPITVRTRWYRDFDAVGQLVRSPEVDTVVCATTGLGGLHAAWAAIDSGKRVAMANKESLVVAGPLMMGRAAETGAEVIPVDSEHSAIFQCLSAGRSQDVRRLVLTASGGPFRGWSREQMRDVTPAMALRHPTWEMGQKITIDSATMMNKALEIVEARWLFGLPADRIAVTVHPQSIAHSFVEFGDGSVICQMSPPDMRIPIQYALFFPERPACPAAPLDWTHPMCLELEPPDAEAFPALALGFETAAAGGTAGAVLNASNEVAVDRFLGGTIRFDQITDVVRSVLSHHHHESRPTLSGVLEADAWARKEAARWT